MMNDAGQRLAIDPKRMYTAGLSGGARVAMKLAMDTGRFAGVIASSAGFPDSQPRKAVPFDVFGTAGTEDFNYLEMREIDRTLTSPHRVAIFDGGHTWLPAELASEGARMVRNSRDATRDAATRCRISRQPRRLAAYSTPKQNRTGIAHFSSGVPSPPISICRSRPAWSAART